MISNKAKFIFKILRDYLQITFILGFDFRIQKSVIIRVMTPLKLVNANFICILHFLFQVCYVEMSQNLLMKTISDIPLTHMINIGAGGNNITITKSCKNQNIVLLCCNQHVFFVFRQINNDSIFYRISIKVFLGLPLVRFI